MVPGFGLSTDQTCARCAAVMPSKKDNCLYCLCQLVAQHSTAQHSTAQHSTAQHSTAQHSTAQHSTAYQVVTINLTALDFASALCSVRRAQQADPQAVLLCIRIAHKDTHCCLDSAVMSHMLWQQSASLDKITKGDTNQITY